MSSFTDSEKVEYALKTTLNITMSKFGYAPFNETPAPPRVFPSNVMSKDLITYGEGDVDENGAYVSGHSQSGNIDTTLTTYESVLKYYKIVCPVTKKVSKAQLRNVLGTTSSQNILGREILDIDFGYSGGGASGANETNFWTQPVNSNFHRLSFFRGHYIDENTVSNKFNYANTHYKGLNLVWNHIADGTDVSSAIDADGNGSDDTKIVPHLKLFLQVQTKFLIGADNKENQCFSHSMMKNMLGLDFKIPVQVNVGEVSGGDTVNAGSTSDITGPGIASGNEWYTQSTAGTINFYAVGHTNTAVDNSKGPDNYPLESNAPLVTFLKYTGDHAGVSGLGGGSGGGGGGGGAAGEASTVLQALNEEPSWTDNSITVESIEGNFGIGTTSPSNAELHIANSGRIRFGTKSHLGNHTSGNSTGHVYNDTYGLYWSNCHADNAQSIGAKIVGINRLGTSSQYNITYVDLAFSLVNEYGGSSGVYDATTELMRLKATNDGGRVGIGTTNPGAPLEIYKKGHNNDEKGGAIILSRFVHGQDGGNQPNDPYRGSCIWHEYNGNDCMMFASSSNANPYTLSPSMVLTNQGNLGIGTTSPDKLLHLKGDYPLKIEYSGNSSYYTLFDYNQISSYGGKLHINHANSNNVGIACGGGNVGIGMDSPSDKLHVQGDVRVIGGIKLQPTQSAASYASYTPLYWGNDPNHYYICPIKYNESTNHGTANYTKLRIAWHTGIWLGAHGNYGGVSFWGDAPESDGTAVDATKIAAIGDKDTCWFNQKVGVINTNPQDSLHVFGNIMVTANKTHRSGMEGIRIVPFNDGVEQNAGGYIKFREDYDDQHGFSIGYNGGGNTDIFNWNGNTFNISRHDNNVNGSPCFSIPRHNGHIGIGTQSPQIIFHVYGWTKGSALSDYTADDGHGAHVSNDDGFSYSRPDGQINGSGGHSWSDIDSDNNIVTHVSAGPIYPGSLDSSVRYSILSAWNLVIDNGCSLLISSDRRIKINIKDVPDDLALYQLRKIPCRYYKYKDWKLKGKKRTIGFIAQEVKEILPMAVKVRPSIIPNIYHHLDNRIINWEEIKDNSDNIIEYKLHCKEAIKKGLRNYEADDEYYDLEDIDISGIKFEFVVNHGNAQEEKEIVITGNSDDTFTFEEKWKYVFCVGYEIQDFHSLDKSKLFALNFSATQEIDRVQQEEIGKLAEQTSKIVELENEVAMLKSELSAIKGHLGL